MVLYTIYEIIIYLEGMYIGIKLADSAELRTRLIPIPARWGAMRAVHARPWTSFLLCEPVFSDLPTNMIQRATTLQEAKESYRGFYKL